MFPADRAPEVDEAVLRAFGWKGTEPHTLDDLLGWHRTARKSDKDYRSISEVVERVTQLTVEEHEKTGRYAVPPTVLEENRRTPDGKHLIGLPYLYDDFSIIHAYEHRITPSRYLDRPLPSPAFQRDEFVAMLKRLGEEDERLLDLKFEVGGDFARDLEVKETYGHSTEWCVRLSGINIRMATCIYTDREAAELEPTGVYLHDIQADINEYADANGDLPDGEYRRREDALAADLMQKYKDCRRAGMSHQLTMHVYTVKNVYPIIQLFRDVGEEYVMAAVPNRISLGLSR